MNTKLMHSCVMPEMQTFQQESDVPAWSSYVIVLLSSHTHFFSFSNMTQHIVLLWLDSSTNDKLKIKIIIKL